jgi:hypothetical protein
MAIRNVTSTLPDREYIRALEEELREIKKVAEMALKAAGGKTGSGR